MIDPDFEARIIALLHDNYSLEVSEIIFEPIGADFNTAVYKVLSTDRKVFFLKMRAGFFSEPSVLVPYHLKKIGLQGVIPAIETNTGNLSISLDSYQLALYPFVEAQSAVEKKLSEDQWQKIGYTIRKLHTADIPKSVIADVKKDNFSNQYSQSVLSFLEDIDNRVFDEKVAKTLAELLGSKKHIIIDLVKQTERFRAKIKPSSYEYVLCHADIHGWNLLNDQNNQVYLIDWDTLILAPKERDLMFVGAGIWDSGFSPSEEESFFYKGYGQIGLNLDLVCYYRFNRILQDIVEYCEYIFLSEDGGDSRWLAIEQIQPNFYPNGTIDRAYYAEKMSRE